MLKSHIATVPPTIARLQARGLAVPADEMLLFRTLITVGRGIAQISEDTIHRSGLVEAEFRVLLQLFSQPDGVGSPGALCAGAAQSPANMTRVTDVLVARQLISREHSELDRRRMILRITASGEALVRQVVPLAYEPVRRLFAQIGAEARSQLLHHLNSIAEAFDALDVSGAEPASDAAGLRP